MADSIQISTEELTNTATNIRNINATMDEKLKAINKQMNDLESTWKSDAGTEIRSAMNKLQPKFTQYKDIVDSYAKFLDDTAAAYENTESVIQNNAAAFN